MGKLCERPGCSEIAALAYGMRTEDLIFWIDVLGGDSTAETGVLCQRHADSMTVPRGWTLDDLRDPDLHLFRPPERPDGPATRRNRTRRRASDETGQLSLGDLGDADHLDDPGALEHDGSDDTTEAPPVEAPPTGVRPTDDLGQDPADRNAADQDAADQDAADQGPCRPGACGTFRRAGLETGVRRRRRPRRSVGGKKPTALAGVSRRAQLTVEIVRSLTAEAAPHELFVHVDDLADYPAWMPLIHEVERLGSDGDGGAPAWMVELRAQVGPFARSKRLRMERTRIEENRVAVFERREADRRDHSEWILRADLEVDESGRTVLTMTMSYDGALWAGPILERVLDDQVRRGRDRLLALVS